jgi:hypothetical protein
MNLTYPRQLSRPLLQLVPLRSQPDPMLARAALLAEMESLQNRLAQLRQKLAQTLLA